MFSMRNVGPPTNKALFEIIVNRNRSGTCPFIQFGIKFLTFKLSIKFLCGTDLISKDGDRINILLDGVILVLRVGILVTVRLRDHTPYP